MATVLVNMEVKTSGIDSLKTTATAMEGVGQAAQKSEQSLNSWSSAQQRAALRMNAMQEAAIKMNQGFTSSDDKAQLFAGTLSKVSTTATATAAALGLPIGQLNALNGVADVAGLGMTKLTTSMVGFNSASVGVAAAGAGVGIMIGNWLNTFPAVTSTVDKLTFALYGMINVERKMGAGEQAALNDKVIKQKDDALKKTLELMKAQGASWKDLERFLKDETKGRETALEMVQRQIRAEAERKALAKAAGSENEARMAKEFAAMEAQAAAEQKLATDTSTIRIAGLKAQAEAEKDLAEKVATYAKSAIFMRKQEREELEGLQKAEAELAAREKASDDAAKARMAQKIADMRAFAGALMQAGQEAGGLFGIILGMGGAAVQVMANLKDKALQNASAWEKLAGVVGGAMAAYSSGSVMGGAAAGAMAGSAFGPWGAAIGAVGGGILGFLGKAKKEAAEAKKMLDEFIRSAGGIDALRAAADRAGVSLDALWDTKKPKEMQKAIDDVQRQLDLFADAWARVDEAAQRYGLTVDDMVPGSEAATRALDQMFEQIYGDYQLLIAAGYDNQAVLEKMAPSVQEYVNASKAAGVAIPESMRPILQQMVDAGLITDEFGTKLTDLSGLTFAESITESVGRIVTAIEALVTALENGITGAEGLNQALVNIGSGVGQFTGVPKSAPPPGSGFAEGGYLPARAGGWRVTVGEGGEGEYMVPESKMGKMGMGGTTINAPCNVTISGSGLSGEAIAAKVIDVWTNNIGGARDRAWNALQQRRIA